MGIERISRCGRDQFKEESHTDVIFINIKLEKKRENGEINKSTRPPKSDSRAGDLKIPQKPFFLPADILLGQHKPIRMLISKWDGSVYDTPRGAKSHHPNRMTTAMNSTRSTSSSIFNFLLPFLFYRLWKWTPTFVPYRWRSLLLLFIFQPFSL